MLNLTRGTLLIRLGTVANILGSVTVSVTTLIPPTMLWLKLKRWQKRFILEGLLM
jgi:hypothetical protein